MRGRVRGGVRVGRDLGRRPKSGLAGRDGGVVGAGPGGGAEPAPVL